MREYVSIVEFIQALQYSNNEDEILSWLGNQNSYVSNNNLYVHVSNSQDSVKLIKGDYIVKTGNGVFKVFPQDRFEETYHLLPVGFDDSLKMIFKGSTSNI